MPWTFSLRFVQLDEDGRGLGGVEPVEIRPGELDGRQCLEEAASERLAAPSRLPDVPLTTATPNPRTATGRRRMATIVVQCYNVT